MRRSRNDGPNKWLGVFACVATVTATAAFAFPLAPRERAVVHITEVGLVEVPRGFEILIFSPGTARVGIGLDTTALLSDTLHLKSLPAITADVTDADVHIQLVGPGEISVGGAVTGGPATHLSGRGSHIVLMKGGVGIHSAP